MQKGDVTGRYFGQGGSEKETFQPKPNDKQKQTHPDFGGGVLQAVGGAKYKDPKVEMS